MTESVGRAQHLAGLVAIVTGAAGGIGAVIANRLLADGFRVVLADRDEAGLRAIGERLGSDLAWPFTVDITSREAVERMAAEVSERWETIDVLVNNAGRTRVGPFASSPEQHWTELLEIDVVGVLRCTQVVLPGMCSRRHGRIVNISSDAARAGLPGQAVYAAAKGAVVAFSKSLAREVAADNVLVNVVSPGPVNTPPLQRLFERQPEFARQLAAEIPVGRIAEPEDVAAAVAFLVSGDANYITGQVLSVNGGWVTA